MITMPAHTTLDGHSPRAGIPINAVIVGPSATNAAALDAPKSRIARPHQMNIFIKRVHVAEDLSQRRRSPLSCCGTSRPAAADYIRDCKRSSIRRDHIDGRRCEDNRPKISSFALYGLGTKRLSFYEKSTRRNPVNTGSPDEKHKPRLRLGGEEKESP